MTRGFTGMPLLLVSALGVAGCSRHDRTVPTAASVAAAPATSTAPTARPPLAYQPVCTRGPARCHSFIERGADGGVGSNREAMGLGATEIRAAYALPDANVTKKIALVVAYHYANAEADLVEYRTRYGLPQCTTASGCLTIVNQDGKTGSPPPAPPPDDDWTVEAALDLDMASAGCPSCKLMLVETKDEASYLAGEKGAVIAGADVVSNSWGEPETATTDESLEAWFADAGAAFFAASGDYGDDPEYPALSAFVTAVGGTILTKDPGSPRGWTEVAASFSGSGCSMHIKKPGWQDSAVPNPLCRMRASSDVSAVADGVAVYNSAYGWLRMQGTSLSTPLVAAIFTATGHAAGGPGFAYANQGAFFDVTTGNNGTCDAAMCNAGTNWDGPTGVGTPNGAQLSANGASATRGRR